MQYQDAVATDSFEAVTWGKPVGQDQDIATQVLEGVLTGTPVALVGCGQRPVASDIQSI